MSKQFREGETPLPCLDSINISGSISLSSVKAGQRTERTHIPHHSGRHDGLGHESYTYDTQEHYNQEQHKGWNNTLKDHLEREPDIDDTKVHIGSELRDEGTSENAHKTTEHGTDRCEPANEQDHHQPEHERHRSIEAVVTGTDFVHGVADLSDTGVVLELVSEHEVEGKDVRDYDEDHSPSLVVGDVLRVDAVPPTAITDGPLIDQGVPVLEPGVLGDPGRLLGAGGGLGNRVGLLRSPLGVDVPAGIPGGPVHMLHIPHALSPLGFVQEHRPALPAEPAVVGVPLPASAAECHDAPSVARNLKPAVNPGMTGHTARFTRARPDTAWKGVCMNDPAFLAVAILMGIALIYATYRSYRTGNPTLTMFFLGTLLMLMAFAPGIFVLAVMCVVYFVLGDTHSALVALVMMPVTAATAFVLMILAAAIAGGFA